MRNIHHMAIFVHIDINLIVDQMTVESDPQLKENDMYVSVEKVYYRIIETKKIWNSLKDCNQYIYFVNECIEEKMELLIPYID